MIVNGWRTGLAGEIAVRELQTITLRVKDDKIGHLESVREVLRAGKRNRRCQNVRVRPLGEVRLPAGEKLSPRIEDEVPGRRDA